MYIAFKLPQCRCYQKVARDYSPDFIILTFLGIHVLVNGKWRFAQPTLVEITPPPPPSCDGPVQNTTGRVYSVTSEFILLGAKLQLAICYIVQEIIAQHPCQSK
jgi:hypothetical protein